jgi:hypothetical protein
MKPSDLNFPTFAYPADYFTDIAPYLYELSQLQQHYDTLLWQTQDLALAHHYAMICDSVRRVMKGHMTLTTNK